MAKTEGRKRVRISKHKKKAWNKYSDIKDIEDFLEERRQDERIGAFLQQPDDELFFVQKEAGCSNENFPLCDKRPLKCFQVLTAYSKVPPPVKPSMGIISKKRRKLLISRLEKESKKITKFPMNKKENSQVGKCTFYNREFRDIWNEGGEKINPEIADLVDYRDEITKKKPHKVPCHRYQKPSLLPAVEVPHPGSSYNPSFEAHQALLSKAVLIEQKKEKESMHIKRVLTDKFPKPGDTPIKEVWLQEMSEGLFDVPDVDKGQGDNQDESYFAMGNPPVRADDRKTRSKKRKQRERRQEERQQLLMKLQQQRDNEVYRLKSIKSQLNQAEILSQQKQKMKNQRQIDRLFKPCTLSRHKYNPPDLEVNLSEEISGTLRLMKAEGSVLEDRFKSLQRRNIIETTIKQKKKRKYKLKVQVKRSHRGIV